MSYTPEYFWKNFRLGTELQVSGSFIYNALYFFDQMECFNNEEEIFEFLYSLSVGIERLEKIAIILLEHDKSTNQEEFEKTLITHSHSDLIDRIKKNRQLNLGKCHNKFIQLLSNFYKSMRYGRFNITSVYEPNQDALKFIEFLQDELNIEIKNNMILATANNDRIKNFIGKTVGKIATQLYEIVKDEAGRLGTFTHELRYGSKPYKIFMCEEFTFHKENSLKKEIIVSLINGNEDDRFIKFAKQIEPLPFDDVTHEYVKYLINPQGNLSLTEELESIYEDNFDKERMSMVEVIGNVNVSFGEDDEDEDFFYCIKS